jgi:ATP dependent DNA ligase C terminal region
MLLFAARRLAADGLKAWADVERCGVEELVGKDEIPQDGGVRYVGAVRFGVTQRLLGESFDAGQALVRRTSPFTDYRERRTTWLEPRIVAEVSFGGSVERGLRDPVLRSVVSSPAADQSRECRLNRCHFRCQSEG